MKTARTARSTPVCSSFASVLSTASSRVLKALLLSLLTMGSAQALAISVNVSISPGTISPGGSAVVSWSSSGANYCTYEGYTGPTSGSVAVSPSSTRTYTVNCYAYIGYASDSATLVVQQPPPPPAPSVSAWTSPGSVYTGASSTLHWNSSNTSSCNYGGTSGSTSVGPYSTSGTRSFTVTCSGPGGSASNTTYLGVNTYPAPSITLIVSPSTIYPGEQVTWTWTTSYASSCSVAGQSAATSGSLPYTYTQLGTHSATLICTGPGGTSSKTRSVTVVPPIAPPTVSLSLSQSSVNIGGAISLTINVGGDASSCTTDSSNWVYMPSPAPYGTPIPLGTSGYSAGQYTFSYSCTNSGGSDSDSVTLTLIQPPAPTADLSLSPSTIYLGQSAQIGLTTTNSASCSFSGAFGSGPFPAQNGPSITVTPGSASEYTYTATCHNGAGQSVSDSVYLLVTSAPPPPPPGTQLSAGFDDSYEARIIDFNADGLTDIYVVLDLAITDLPGVDAFYLAQNQDYSFSLVTSLTPADHALGEQAPLASSQVELYAVDMDGNTIKDLFLRNLSSEISGVNDVLVFASPTDGAPPTGFAEADEELVSFFSQGKRWLSDPGHILRTAIDNNRVTLTPDGAPYEADWRLDYLVFTGYRTGPDELTPYISDGADLYDPLADIFGCNDPVAYAGYNSFCYFDSGVWWVTRTATSYTIDIDFSDFNQDLIELIYPDSSSFFESGMLREVLATGFDFGSSSAILLEDILEGVLDGNPVFAGVLGGTIPWDVPLPGTDEVSVIERRFVLPAWLSKAFLIIGALVTPGNINDNWDLYHYANAEKYNRVAVVQKGLKPGTTTGYIYFTDDIYPTGWFAKECLALPELPPIGYWTFRQEDEVIAVPLAGDVPPLDTDPIDGLGYGVLQGGGKEWTSTQPLIPVTVGRPFIQIPVGTQPTLTINCHFFNSLF